MGAHTWGGGRRGGNTERLCATNGAPLAMVFLSLSPKQRFGEHVKSTSIFSRTVIRHRSRELSPRHQSSRGHVLLLEGQVNVRCKGNTTLRKGKQKGVCRNREGDQRQAESQECQGERGWLAEGSWQAVAAFQVPH